MQPHEHIRSDVEGAAQPASSGKGSSHRLVPAVATTTILNTPIAVVDLEGFLRCVTDWLARRQPNTSGIYIVFRDVHGVVRALDEPELAAAHDGAFMNLPDGTPLAWVCRLRGFGGTNRLPGPDALPALCSAGLAHGWRHAFLGSTPARLEALIANLARSYPGINIVEAISPPFRPVSAEEMDDQIARFASVKPDFVWVGLGCPKQEVWMAQNAWRIPGAIAMGVGAAFDFHSGAVRRAPAWIQHVGLEFLHRVSQEPTRLARRYAHFVPRFIYEVAKQEATRRFRLR